jgi:hypothetical protein
MLGPDGKAGAMNDFFTWLAGEKGQLALAGALGGLVRWLTLRERWQDGMISLVVGAICALYLGPLAIPAIEPIVGKIVVDPASRGTLSGFILGIGGIAVTGFVLDVWKARRRQTEGDGK